VASTTSSTRLRAALLGFATAALLVLAMCANAFADDVAPTPATGATGATGTVGALGADPTIRVAARKHCVSSKVRISPTYSGGGGLVKSYLYLNSELVATRTSIGAIAVSVSRFQPGLNGIELISEFSDGRVASINRTIRRCGGH
jgi:opacity protein-like surface antigen